MMWIGLGTVSRGGKSAFAGKRPLRPAGRPVLAMDSVRSSHASMSETVTRKGICSKKSTHSHRLARCRVVIRPWREELCSKVGDVRSRA